MSATDLRVVANVCLIGVTAGETALDPAKARRESVPQTGGASCGDARSGTPPRVNVRDSLERQTGGCASVTTQTNI